MDLEEKLNELRHKKIPIISILAVAVCLGIIVNLRFYIQKPIEPITAAVIQTEKKKVIYPAQYSDTNITLNAVKSNPALKNITFSSNGSMMANSISAITPDRNLVETNAAENGTWLWTPISQITEDYAQTVISGAQRNGIKNIYISIDPYLDIYAMPSGQDKEKRKTEFADTLEMFIAMAHKNNITVDAEAGWRNWSEDGNTYKAFAVINFAIEFNKTHKEKFRGFQYDVEPYLLSEYQENKSLVLTNFLDLIGSSLDQLNNSDLQFSVVIPEFYDGSNSEIAEFYYKGKTGTAFDHLLKILERRAQSKIIIMSYRNFSLGDDSSVELSETEVSKADDFHTKIIVAQETGDVLPPYITFYKTDKKYYEKQVALIEKAFFGDKSFGGIATHYVNSYLDLK